jgi:type I restriction enzyme S subunit
MEIVKGFKQTDIGKIPEDWHTQLFKNYCWYQEGPGLRNWQFTSDGIKVINVTNLVEGYLDLDKTERYISLDEFEKMYKHFLIDEDDILVASSGNSYAKVSVVRKQDLPLVMNTSVIRFKPTKKLDYKFLLAFLNSKLFKNQIDLMITGGAQPNFGPYHLNKLIINIPPSLGEQIAIASAISDSVDLINNLDKLIEKKKKIKIGAMQQLLKPKKSIEVKKLGDICEIKKGQLITEATAINGDIPVIAGGKKPSYFHNKANRLNKTITISGSGANAGFVAYFETPIFASDCSTIEEGSTYSIKYIYYNLQLLQNRIYKAQTGGAQPHIHPSDLYPLEISFPELSTQNFITTILSDMDNEIDLLEKKLSKNWLIKEGMMQNLLTGKLRLV